MKHGTTLTLIGYCEICRTFDQHRGSRSNLPCGGHSKPPRKVARFGRIPVQTVPSDRIITIISGIAAMLLTVLVQDVAELQCIIISAKFPAKLVSLSPENVGSHSLGKFNVEFKDDERRK